MSETVARMPDKITIGDKYRPAMEITSQDEADAYFAACVEHTMRFDKTREEAEAIERQNLGYFAGYYDSTVMARVNRLFCTKHPIFGESAPTAEEAFNAGMAIGDAAKAEKEQAS